MKPTRILQLLTWWCLISGSAAVVNATDEFWQGPYDPARDALADTQAAGKLIAGDGRHVLVVVGNERCIWCFWLDRHLARESMDRAALAASFEMVRVYYGDDNPNVAFFAGKPDFVGFPHLYVIDASGAVLESQHASMLLHERRFDSRLIQVFAARWRPVKSAQHEDDGPGAGAAGQEEQHVPG